MKIPVYIAVWWPGLVSSEKGISFSEAEYECFSFKFLKEKPDCWFWEDTETKRSVWCLDKKIQTSKMVYSGAWNLEEAKYF